MITKKTDKKVKRAQLEIGNALITNRLKSYQEIGLRAIKTSIDKWLEAHGRPEERGKQWQLKEN